MSGRRGRAPIEAPWSEIKDAYMLGEPAKSICKRYPQVNPNTLRFRASREGWITPRNLKSKLKSEVAKVNAAVLRGELEPSVAEKQKDTIRTTARTIAARQEAHAELVAEIAGTKLRKNRLPDIKTWRDADIADKMARRAMGMDDDKPDAVVNVGVLASGGVFDEFSMGPPVEEGG